MFQTKIKRTSLYGLKYELDFKDDCDFPKETIEKAKQHNINFHYSECNKRILKHLLDELIACPQAYVMEIGVHYAAGGDKESSTIIMKDYVRNHNYKYLGVDINDKRYLEEEGFHTIQCDSSDHDVVTKKLKELEFGELDLLHIDGNHSVKNVWSDWQYAKLVRSGGVIILHDTNYHPGPSLIIDAIDPSMFEVTKFCEHDRDWGVSIARKK